MKMMRKMEKQAMARAAKEARKQQGIPQQQFVLCLLLTGAQCCKDDSGGLQLASSFTFLSVKCSRASADTDATNTTVVSKCLHSFSSR